ncbi:DegV family protein [Paenibacillus sediminis]|uniref:DegV family protein with EDD domain n=1 Tax=Paenibacillus sediminis TaxID=664909 RepID=A0ABS4GZ82_9BACL|nr:DegV family protein [Paenibacillus sediminis]MBP1935582.1 DegV family protein with EDD domain [Paenibacillus sediminis]
MSKVVIMTDSTADIPDELVQKYNIQVVPLQLVFGDQTFMDGVDITAAEFYAKLRQSSTLPTTSQPAPAVYVDAYEQIAKKYPGSPIVSIHLSSGMSGTYQSARLAATMVEADVDITAIDSLSASYGYGQMVVEAARLAAEGKSVEEIVAVVEKFKKERKLYFLVDTLEYLQKGGRIGKAAAMIGTLLNIKPILSIDDEGIIYAVEKVRGHKKAVARTIELFKQHFDGKKLHVAIGHTANQASAEQYLTHLQSEFEIEDVVFTNIGPVIGSHVGEGTIAVFIWPAS